MYTITRSETSNVSVDWTGSALDIYVDSTRVISIARNL